MRSGGLFLTVIYTAQLSRKSVVPIHFVQLSPVSSSHTFDLLFTRRLHCISCRSTTLRQLREIGSCNCATARDANLGDFDNVSDLGGAMSQAEQNAWAALSPLASEGLAEASWYAIQTWPKHERKIYVSLVKDGVEAFLPLMRHVRRWSDRRMVLEIPLFSCYVFLRIVPVPGNRIPVLRTPG